MTFTHALSQIPSEKQIYRALKRIIFGTRVACPDCTRQLYVVCITTNKLWRCKKCRNKFSITSVTWLKGMKISVQHLWCLVWCWQKKLNIQQVQALTRLSVPTIRRYYALFRDNLQVDNSIVLQHTVQMDEMFVRGGFVIGAKDVTRKSIKLYVIPRKAPTKTDATEFMYQHIKPGSTLCTDGGGIYRGIQHWWPIQHTYELHNKFEFEITSEIEGIWANLRTFIRRMYHHTTLAKLPYVVAEFEARFSQPQLFSSVLTFLQNSLCPVTFAL